MLKSEIEIRASASRVWSILTELDRYPEWNPFITKAVGSLRRGKELELAVAAPDRPVEMLTVKVLEVDPIGRVNLRMNATCDHQIVLEPIPTGVRVLQLRRYQASNGNGAADRIALGIEMMNAALKARAER